MAAAAAQQQPLFIIIIINQKIVAITFVGDGFLVAEVGESRVGLDVVLLRDLFVIDLDKVDAKVIRLVVDRLQFLEHLVTLPAVPPVCESNG